jgi:hypothetical protein
MDIYIQILHTNVPYIYIVRSRYGGMTEAEMAFSGATGGAFGGGY